MIDSYQITNESRINRSNTEKLDWEGEANILMLNKFGTKLQLDLISGALLLTFLPPPHPGPSPHSPSSYGCYGTENTNTNFLKITNVMEKQNRE